MMFRSNFVSRLGIASLSLALIASPVMADSPVPATVPVAESAEANLAVATINAEGELVGTVVADIDGTQQPVAAKITLSKDGVVIESVVADENGLFSFASVEPGSYEMFGAVDNFAGSQSYEVSPFSAASYQPSSLVLQPAAIDSYDVIAGAPACSMSGSSCGGGGGGGGYGCAGSNGRLLRLGLIGGIVAIAVSSPDK